MVAYPLRLSRVGALRGADEITQHDVVDRSTMEQCLTGALEETTGGRRLRVRGIARFQKPLRREDRIRPGGAAKLFRRPLRDARCLLGRRDAASNLRS